MNWREQAEALFFIDKKSIKEISVEIGVSRKSISKYLNSLTTYNDERNYRKIINQKKRKEYKRNWDSENRANRYSVIDKDTIKREHIMAVSILSREKYR
ncbi:hypothetical protein B5E58_10880 [Tyzzerella sp. An114]|uniref:hypothetical protein n=1 Tax=Tyzzerella sp. An114 TaxID=1965545 RepID=UPI000B43C08A|nr:hypothetical protein [Tyzzerella sp. An114]OUQ56344.1 hypothetical protein B5E58_10880 [Tyzzerella sp. An114]